MASVDEPTSHLAESGVTIHSDSEQYSAGEEASTSRESSSSSTPMILYQPPTVWGLIRGTAINLLLPFINGMMLGFGELFAHEAAFRLGWSGTKVRTATLVLFDDSVSWGPLTRLNMLDTDSKCRSFHCRGEQRIPSALASRFGRSQHHPHRSSKT